MNHYVPDFEMDEEYSIPAFSDLTRTKKSPMAEEDTMELLWHDGQVVVQSQNQRSLKRSHIADAVTPAENSTAREIRPEQESATELFMQEDEMASWLHFPLEDSSFERDLYTDLVCPASCTPVAPPQRTAPIPDVRTSDVRTTTPSSAATAISRPPIPPAKRADVESPMRFQNFFHFSRPKWKPETGASSTYKTRRESVIAKSSEGPGAAAPYSRVFHVAGSGAQVSGGNVVCGTTSGAAEPGTSSAAGGGKDAGTCEVTMTSSPGGSGPSVTASAEPGHKPLPMEDRKRKGREADGSDCQSEDVEFEYSNPKKQGHGSTSVKKSRAAEVHNLSERRRRDRINEKMRALQELIPRCNKSDKASMLDDAIEYLKSLQLQVQMMSMGCSMVPVMFPGVQQCMPPMAMGMEMGMNSPMMAFPSVFTGSALPTPPAAAHLGPRFPMPAYHVPPIPLTDSSRIQATSQSDPMLNSLGGMQNPNQRQFSNYADPYQQYLGLHQMQISLPQNQVAFQPITSKEVNSRENPESG